MGRGLDQNGRDNIRDMVRNKADGDDIRAKMTQLFKDKIYEWDFDKNRSFINELHNAGYHITADYLRDNTGILLY